MLPFSQLFYVRGPFDLVKIFMKEDEQNNPLIQPDKFSYAQSFFTRESLLFTFYILKPLGDKNEDNR